MTTESPQLKALLQSLMHPGLKSIDLSLGRMERYLAEYGHPERSMPPVVHVAGTNGKGSTMAFLRAIMEAADYVCHQFTSPHLVHFKERIVVAGEMLDEPELIARLEAIRMRTESHPLTFFEANAALAFDLFAEIPADVTLLEVGMGGRFDATNVVETPALCIITPIGMDHQEYLGDTLAKIAYEKAGIIKLGVPVVVAPQAEQAMGVIEQVARERSAPLIKAQPLEDQPLGLVGAHQNINAGVAKAAAELLHADFLSLTEKAISEGLAHAHWPGRLQRLTQGPLVNASPAELWLDGGHNIDAARMLVQWIKMQKKPVHLLCAMTNQKDPAAFLGLLEPELASVTCLDIPEEPLSLSAKTLQTHCQNGIIATNLEQGASILPADSIGLIAGSLYLAGYVLQNNG